MKTRKLGSREPDFSVIGYGAWEASEHWGSDLDEGRTIEAIHAAVDVGMNWIDTAEVYGPHTSEKIVGNAIKGLDVMVATKVAPKPAGTGFSRDDVRRACESSLVRLGRDVIDLFQLHWPDGEIPLQETWSAMAELQDEGSVRYIGVSNFSAEQIATCEAIRHVDSLQPQLSLLHRDNEALIGSSGSSGTGSIVYGPLAYGLLTGAIDRDTEFHPDDWRSGNRGFVLYQPYFAPDSLDRHLKVIDGLRPIAERLDVAMADLAIAWTLTRPGVTGAIVGSRNPAHVRANAAAASIDLDAPTLAEIEGLL